MIKATPDSSSPAKEFAVVDVRSDDFVVSLPPPCLCETGVLMRGREEILLMLSTHLPRRFMWILMDS